MDAKKLSVAVIAQDAGEILAETLDNVKSIADEIVVVDCGSSDDTAAVAGDCGAKVITHQWSDDFSAARNVGLENVTGDWVLWLDAGEVIEDSSVVRAFVDGEATDNEAYMIIVYIPPVREALDGEQVARVRLMPNRDGLWFDGMVRESIEDSAEQLGIAISAMPGRILRGVREHEPSLRTDRAKRNIRIADAQIRATQPTARMLNCLADAFQVLEDHGRSMLLYRHALKASERGSIDMLEAYYGMLTSCDKNSDQQEEQLQICLEALEIFPLDAQLLCAMANYLQAQGRLDLASRAYETAHQFGTVNPQSWHLDKLKEVATICFSLTLQMQKQDEKATAILKAATAENPKEQRLWRHLLDLHIRLGERDEALAVVDHLDVDGPEAMRSAVRGACLAAEKNWIAARAYLDTAHGSGCRDIVRVRWLAMTLLSVGQIDRAMPVLKEWQEIDPNNADVQTYLDAIATAERDAEQRAQHETPASQGRQIRVDDPGAPVQSPSTPTSPASNPLQLDS